MITRYRRHRNILMVVLLIAVTFMTVGFAAFSSELTISSNAIVKPDASAFKVVFSSSGTEFLTNDVSGTATGDATAGNASISNSGDTPKIENLRATFTGPGETVKYEFYVYNSGAYVAYLTDIKFNNVDGESLPKVCTAIDSTSVTETLMTNACNDIIVTVDIGDNSFTSSNSMISGNVLNKSEYKKVTVTISYADNGNSSDGDFMVEFGDINFTYSTVDTASNLISFTTYQFDTLYAEEGMTWGEWVNSEYNTIGAYVENGILFSKNDKIYIIYDMSPAHVSSSDVIEAGYTYGNEEYIIFSDE